MGSVLGSPPGDIVGVVAGNGVLVASVGGGLYTSAEGRKWTQVFAASDEGDGLAVAWGDHGFVAVTAGAILRSTDGLTWQTEATPEADLVAVARGGGRYVAVGKLWETGSCCQAVAYVSSDGESWSAEAISTSLDPTLSAVEWTAHGFVAVGDAVFSSADGTSWVQQAAPAVHSPLVAVASASDRVVAIAPSEIASSTDLVEWTVTPRADEPYLHDVTSNGSTLVATSERSILVSSNGTSWSRFPQEPGGRAAVATWTGDRFVVVGAAVLASSSGTQWSLLAGPGPDFTAAAFGDGTYVIAGSIAATGEPVVYRSGDGKTWQQATTPPPVALADITWRGADFLSLGEHGGLWRSPDGATWTEVSPPGSGSNTYTALAVHGDTLVVTGRVGTGGAIFRSGDGGTSWQLVDGGGLLVFNDVDWTGEEFLAVGARKVCNPYETAAGGVVFTSSDGAAWTEQYATLDSCGQPASVDALHGIAHGGGRDVSVGSVRGVRRWGLYAADRQGDSSWRGRAWLAEQPMADQALHAVAWTGSKFVAAGEGWLAASETGAYWSSWRLAPSTASLEAAVAGAHGVVAVGDGGRFFHLISGFGAPCTTALSFDQLGTESLLIPAVAHIAGAAGSLWTSDVVLHRSGTSPGSSLTLSLLRRDRANDQVLSATSSLPSSLYSISIPDVVSARFGFEDAAGALALHSQVGLLVSTRTWTPGPHGSYGQYVPALDPADAATSLRLIQLTSTVAFRTNVGVVSVNADPTSVTISFYRPDGSGPIATRSLSLAPFGVQQLTDVLSGLGDVPDAFAIVTADHPVLAYGSVVDRRTGDPTLILPMPPSSAPLLLAGAAHTDGFGGTHWRTDLEIHNPGPADAAYTLELLRERQANPSPQKVAFQLAAGRSVRYPDAVASVFAASGAAAVRVTPTQGAVTANARTYTEAPGGSYGQLVPAVPLTDAATSLRAIQLSQSADAASGFRTNLGLVNLSGATVSVTVELRRGDGTLLGTRVLSLQPHEYRQENGIIASVTSEDVPEAYATISSSTPNAALLAYASVVDNRSGDPFWVPAR